MQLLEIDERFACAKGQKISCSCERLRNPIGWCFSCCQSLTTPVLSSCLNVSRRNDAVNVFNQFALLRRASFIERQACGYIFVESA